MAKKDKEIKVEEANVLPVMNIMFLLIPALLLAMEVASMAAIVVSPPKFSAAPSDSKPEEEEKKEKPLNLKVFIMEDGYRITSSAQQEGAAAGASQDSSKPSIKLAKPGAPMDDYERYDYAALEAKAQEYKNQYPTEVTVTVSAENTIPMQVLVSSMDALRGTDCKLIKAIQSGEAVPKECLFWQPVVEAGAG